MAKVLHGGLYAMSSGVRNRAVTLGMLLKALRWEVAPVITDFDPRFNQKRLMFFERFYQPFLGKNQRIQEEPIYDK